MQVGATSIAAKPQAQPAAAQPAAAEANEEDELAAMMAL